MIIRKATIGDLPAINNIYDEIHAAEEQGYASIGWQRGVYPTSETARNAIQHEELFVAEDDNRIVSAAIINRRQLDMYRKANWIHNAEDREVMIIHTLVVSPLYAGNGYGKRFISFYESYAAANGCRCLRLDTQEKNIVARNLYRNLGYTEVDTVTCVFNGLKNIRLVLLEKNNWIAPGREKQSGAEC